MRSWLCLPALALREATFSETESLRPRRPRRLAASVGVPRLPRSSLLRISSKSEAELAFSWGLGAAAGVVGSEDCCVDCSDGFEGVCLGGWEGVLEEELYRRVLVRKDCWNRGCWFSNHGVGRARSPRAKSRMSIVVESTCVFLHKGNWVN